MKQLLLSFLLLTVIKVATAQTTGQIAYKMDFSSDDPDKAEALSMMEGSSMDMYFMPDKTRVDVKIGAIMVSNTITNTKEDKELTLMSMMGQKVAMESVLSKNKEGKKDTPQATITKETKEIIGFKCTKATVTTGDGKKIVVWFTTDLNVSLDGQASFADFVVNGVPLEFSVEGNGVTKTFVATKFEKKVDEKLFSLVIPEGYTLTSDRTIRFSSN